MTRPRRVAPFLASTLVLSLLACQAPQPIARAQEQESEPEAVASDLSVTQHSATIGGVPTNSLAYQVSATITIGAGESLNIDPGVVLKFNAGTYVSNSGLLTALGGSTADSLIYSTSIDDDKAPAGATHHRAALQNHHVDGDRDGGLKAVHHHPQ